MHLSNNNVVKKDLLSSKSMYLTIAKILQQSDALMGASEAHGLASGMLSMNNLATANTWVQELYEPGVNLAEYERIQLTGLFEQTQTLLNDEGCEFELFLPDDDEPLHLRVDALRHWCLGYLSGVGFTGSETNFSDECTEMLGDIVEFTRVDEDVEGEEDEVAFTELQEYIRVGVQFIREDQLQMPGDLTLH